MSRTIARRLGTLSALVVLVLSLTSTRNSTGVQAQPVVPDSAECSLPSLSEEEVRALLPTPSPTPEVFQLPTEIPSGEPVNDATEESVRDAITTFYACANAGMPVETINLFSPRVLSRAGGGQIETDFSATVTPVPQQERAAIVAVWNIQRLADDRVAATVTVGRANDEDQERALIFVLVRDDDRWLVDELTTQIMRDDQQVTIADAVGSPPAATPAR